MGTCFVTPECCEGTEVIPNCPSAVVSTATSALRPTATYVSKSRSPRPSPASYTGLKCWIMDTNRSSPIRAVNALRGNDVCVTYFGYDPRPDTYVPNFSSVSNSTFEIMLTYPSIYGNLTACTSDYCNSPENVRNLNGTQYEPEQSSMPAENNTTNSSGLKCYAGMGQSVYPAPVSTFSDVDTCIRYYFKPSYDTEGQYVYSAVSIQVAEQMQSLSSIYQELYMCQTEYCNTPSSPK
jgi:hypothetical protein